MELKVEIDDAGLKRKLALLSSPQTARELNKAIGGVVLERIKDHLAQMSVTRHKTADRLGARHTGFYENAPGRTVLEKADENGATIVVKNTPGLSRAYDDLVITPTGGREWLTVPVHRIAYGKRVADLRTEGHTLFRPGKARILAETTGGKKKKLRPLYALVKSVRVPKDEGLLPTGKELQSWAKDATGDFFEAMELLGG